MITTFSTAVIERAIEILDKHRQKEKPWVTEEILDLCNKMRELRKNRFEPEGSDRYKEVNNIIKRCMKNAKENWIREQCSEIKETLRKMKQIVLRHIATNSGGVVKLNIATV